MNKGLLGFSNTAEEGYAGVYRSPLFSIAGNATLTVRHPFSTPIIAQAVFKCMVASGSYVPGDLSYVHDMGQNSTVNVTGMGFTRVDGSRVAYTFGQGVNLLVGDPGATYVNIANTSWMASIHILGVQRLHNGSLTKDRAVRRWRTEVRPVALSTLYSFPNRRTEVPAFIWPRLVCLSPEAGYVPGDEIDPATTQGSGGTGAQWALRVNSRKIDLWISGPAVLLRAVNAAGSIVTLTPSKWGVYLEVIG